MHQAQLLPPETLQADEDSGSTSSSGRGLLQAPRTQQPQVHQPQQQQAGAPTDRRLKLDTRIEDAILQTHAPADQKQPGAQQRLEEAQRRAALAAAGSRPTPARKPTVGGVQMQPKQQQQKQRVAQQAAQAALLEQQQRQAQEQAQRANAAREEQRAQQTLGRGSLRARTGVAKQPAVTGSRKDDVFARHMEWQLAKARERLLQQQQMQQQAVKAPGGGGAARAPIARAPIAPGVVTAPVPQQQQQQQQPQKQHTSLLLIVAMTLAMAAAGGIGALPFFFVRSMSAGATGVATAVACGVMLAASFDLVHDGENRVIGGGQLLAPCRQQAGHGLLWQAVGLTCQPAPRTAAYHPTHHPLPPAYGRRALRPRPHGGRRAAGRLVHPLGAAAPGPV